MNTNFTKNPIVGTPLTPSVIKQIHTAVRRFMPIAGNGIRTTVTAGGTIISAIPAPASKKQKDKPLPFEVRYDGTLDDGAGGWKIYLPTEHLVQFDGEYLDPLNGVTPILDANGDETGWYSFDEITLQDDHLWLVISESSGTYTASFANAEDQNAVANTCIAEVSYEEAEQSTPETITIKQSVVGAIVMSSGGGGDVVPDDVSTEFCPHDDAPGADNTHEGELQIKGWHKGTPRAAYDLANTLKQPNPASPDEKPCVVVRNQDGTLSYMIVGDMSNVMLLDVDQTVTSSKTFTLTQYFGTTSAKRPRPASLNGIRLTLTGNDYGDAFVSWSRGRLVLAGCGSGTTTPAANCVILQVSPTLIFGNDEMRTNGQVVLSAGWAHSNTKSLKVNNTEVAKILSSADVNIPLPSSVDISALNGVNILTGLDFGVNTVTGGYGLKFKTRQITVNNGVLALGQEITNIIPTTPISSIVS